MSDYMEQFVIPMDGTYGIDDGNGVWRNGCRIFTGKDRSDARAMLHRYSCNHLRAALSGHRERVAHIERTLNKIQGDPFYLGRFSALPS